MKPVTALREAAGDKWIPLIYRDKIRVLRTRAFDLGVTAQGVLGRNNDPAILFTLLGIELKLGRRRLACPDLSTARYLRVFARIGVKAIAVPYDISKLAALADELESSWQHTLLLLETQNLSDQAQNRVLAALKKAMRLELEETGAGPLTPEFKQTTKQQKYHQNKK